MEAATYESVPVRYVAVSRVTSIPHPGSIVFPTFFRS
jgi:hypothetical protein